MVDQKCFLPYNYSIETKQRPGMIELNCVSVAGGWQTAIKGTEVLLGPVFNNITDLWMWQKNNIFAQQKQLVDQ